MAAPTLTASKPTAKQRQRASERQRRTAAKAEKARQQEAKAEAVAPAAQRKAVIRADGEIYRHERVSRDGVVFVRSNPIEHLVARNKGMANPVITKAHKDAVDRLLSVWDQVGEGIGIGASDWGRAGGGGGGARLAPAGHDALLAQVTMQRELDVAATWLGGLWGIVRDVGLRGITVVAWSEAAGMNPQTGIGYLRAALDRLVDLYAQKERPGRVRSVEIAERKVSA